MTNTKSPITPNDWKIIGEVDKSAKACTGLAYDIMGLSYMERRELFGNNQVYLQDLREVIYKIRGDLWKIRAKRPKSPYDRQPPTGGALRGG